MGRVFGSTVQGELYYCGFLFGRDLFWPTRTRSILNNASQSSVLITFPPEQHGGERSRQLACQHFIGDSFRGTQNDLDSERDRLRSASQFHDLEPVLRKKSRSSLEQRRLRLRCPAVESQERGPQNTKPRTEFWPTVGR